MLYRKILILCSLAVLLVKADLEADVGAQAMSTDQDSTSDEAPTESMNAISPDVPKDEPQYYNGATVDAPGSSAESGNNAPQLIDVTGADAAKTSTEEQDEDESADSDEVVKNTPAQRASVSQKALGKRSKSAPAKRRSRPRREI